MAALHTTPLASRLVGVADPDARPSRPLSSIPAGQVVVVERTTLSADDAAYLCAMGLCERAHVRVCRAGEPCVVAVGGIRPEKCHCGGSCRIGLSREIAGHIFVRLADARPALSGTSTPPSAHTPAARQ